MKEVSHGGTSFIYDRERSAPVKGGFTGAACARIPAPSSSQNTQIHA